MRFLLSVFVVQNNSLKETGWLFQVYTVICSSTQGADDSYLIRFATQLRLSVPIDEGKAPIQVGNSFWFRREALQILSNNISFCDGVLEESGGLDDNKMCAIELLCPFVAQQNGYYTAMIFTPSQASIYLRNNK